MQQVTCALRHFDLFATGKTPMPGRMGAVKQGSALQDLNAADIVAAQRAEQDLVCQTGTYHLNEVATS